MKEGMDVDYSTMDTVEGWVPSSLRPPRGKLLVEIKGAIGKRSLIEVIEEGEKILEGKVVRVGKGVSVKEGSSIAFASFSGRSVGKGWRILEEDAVLGLLEKE